MPVGAVGDPDQSALLGLLQRRRLGDAGQQRQPDRLAERNQFEHVAHGRGEGPDPGVDQVGQARRKRDLAAPAPDPVRPGHLTACARGRHQLAHEQGVARGQPGEFLGRPGLDRPAQHRGEQVVGLGLGQRRQLGVLEQPLGPQRRDRRRHRLGRAQRAQQRGALANEQVGEGGRGRVEQMRVVDREHDGPAVRVVVQRVDGPAQQPGGGETGRWVGWQHLGQAAEGQAGAGDVGRGHVHRVLPGRKLADRLLQQAALAHPGAAAEDQAVIVAISGRGRQTRELVGAPDEVPVSHRVSISRSVTLMSLPVGVDIKYGRPNR